MRHKTLTQNSTTFTSSSNENQRKKLQVSENNSRMPGLYEQFIAIEKKPNHEKETRKPRKSFNNKSNQLKQPIYINDLHQIAALGLLKRLQSLERNTQKLSELLFSVDTHNRIPLDVACANGHCEIVAKLLNAHKDLNRPYKIVNFSCYTPLITAIRSYLDVLRKFYNLNILLNSNNAKLHERYEKTITLLIKEQPEYINAVSSNKNNVLSYVITEMGLLLHVNKRINAENRRLNLHKLKDLAKILLATDIKLDDKTNSVIELAQRKNVSELLDELIFAEPKRREAHCVNSLFFNIQSTTPLKTTPSNTLSIKEEPFLKPELFEPPISLLSFYKTLNVRPPETSNVKETSRHAFVSGATS